MALNHARRGLLVATLLLALAAGAFAGPPAEQLKPEIDRVLRVLEDPRLKGAGRTKERREALRAIAGPLFAWTDMAQRALGRHWQGRTETEREEFLRVFRELLERSYMATIERYSGEQIVYAGDWVQGDQATVRTKLVTHQDRTVAIDYRMSRKGNRWLIADVLVEGVSLVSNFRSQFDEILQTSSYQHLLQRMRSQDFTKRRS